MISKSFWIWHENNGGLETELMKPVGDLVSEYIVKFNIIFHIDLYERTFFWFYGTSQVWFKKFYNQNTKEPYSDFTSKVLFHNLFFLTKSNILEFP